MAKGLLILPSYVEAVRELPKEDQLKMWDAVFDKYLFDRETELMPHLRGFMKLMSPTIEKSQRRYESKVENGKKGGAPKGNQNAKKKSTEQQPKTTENKQEYDLDSDYDFDYDSDCDYESDKDSALDVVQQTHSAEAECVKQEKGLRGKPDTALSESVSTSLFPNEKAKLLACEYRKEWLLAKSMRDIDAMKEAKINLQRYCNVTIDSEGNFKAMSA